jgi:hypothetical protein
MVDLCFYARLDVPSHHVYHTTRMCQYTSCLERRPNILGGGPWRFIPGLKAGVFAPPTG